MAALNAPDLTLFRVLGDSAHTASKIILIYAIHRNRSAEGVSLLTQLLYIMVFGTRYLDLLWVPPWWHWYNFSLKIFYITSSAYIVWLMMRVFARTREREQAWKLATWTLSGSAIAAPIVTLIFKGWRGFHFTEIIYSFSLILESVCVLPQLLLLRQTSVPTVLDSFYLVALGSYRGLYIINWIVRGATTHHFDPITVIFGVVQTALYVDFAWVYYSRQRVKLRGGGVVDSDDLRKSFLVRRFIGTRPGQPSVEEEEEEGLAGEDAALAGQENGTVRTSVPKHARSWGPRGISVSADDTLAAHDQVGRPAAQEFGISAEGDARMVDPAHFADDDEDEIVAPSPPAKDANYTPRSNPTSPTEPSGPVGSSAEEWQENTGDGK